LGGIHWLEILLFSSIQTKLITDGIFSLFFEETYRSGFKTPSKAQWRRYRPPQNAHPPETDCAFSAAGTLPLNLVQGFETTFRKT